MELFNIMAILMVLSAIFGYVNHRFLKLPMIIGLMLTSVVFSLFLFFLGHMGLGIEKDWEEVLRRIDFNKTLMVGMLSFLLFAGALQVDMNEFLKKKWEIGVYATMGVFISTFMVGTLTFFMMEFVGIKISYIYCLLFGALISPTDPIAVLGMLRSANAPKSLEIQIAGESLFNDGIGVVVFAVLFEAGSAAGNSIVSHALILFVRESLGGIALGLLCGWAAYLVLKSIDNYQIEILVTIALVTGLYALATAIHTSGPISIVVAGMLIGNRGRQFAMSEKTRRNLDMFWELIDEILNALLFVLIGLELLMIDMSVKYFIAALMAVPIVLLSRFISIGLPMRLLTIRSKFSFETLNILTLGGLRGGIAVALALALPPGPARDVILTVTYFVVVFSILVQGLTFKLMIKARQG
jgi:CPA1 family monovalent cation:H+ antiporter